MTSTWDRIPCHLFGNSDYFVNVGASNLQISDIVSYAITYDEYVGQDFHGNDISCGGFNSQMDIEAACDLNSDCIGYSVWNGNPWCLKKGQYRFTARSDHTFYLKKT